MAAPKKAAASTAQDKTDGGSPPEFTREQELKALRDMLLIRRFEEKAGQLYGMGAIGGFCHLYIGQEAVVVGMQMALKPGDQVITGYRDHGHMLATGMEANGVMAELTGRRGTRPPPRRRRPSRRGRPCRRPAGRECGRRRRAWRNPAAPKRATPRCPWRSGCSR